MPTKFQLEQRVSHKTYGLGTVTEIAGDDSVRVEFDDDATIRTFMLSLGTLAPVGDIAVEHPPTDQVRKPEAALLRAKARSLTTASPEAPAIAKSVMQHATAPGISVTPMENTMPDPLINDMNSAIAERGKGSGAALCATLGLAGGSHKNWRTHGRIPENHRAGVRAWIDKPTITAIRVEKTKPAPKAVKTAKIDKLLRLVPKPKPAPILPPPIRCAVDAGKILAAMGLTITTAWVQEDGVMRAKAVAILP